MQRKSGGGLPSGYYHLPWGCLAFSSAQLAMWWLDVFLSCLESEKEKQQRAGETTFSGNIKVFFLLYSEYSSRGSDREHRGDNVGSLQRERYHDHWDDGNRRHISAEPLVGGHLCVCVWGGGVLRAKQRWLLFSQVQLNGLWQRACEGISVARHLTPVIRVRWCQATPVL